MTLFTGNDESVNGRCRWVEEDEVVLPMVVALEMVDCGGREEHRKLPLRRERERCGERERQLPSWRESCVVVVSCLSSWRGERVAAVAVVAVVVVSCDERA